MERDAIATIGPSLASGPILPAALLHSLRCMAAAGHRPTRYIVLRLTDRRVKAFATAAEAADPMSRLGQLRNEFGPLSEAFLVGSEPRQEGLMLFVEDLLTGSRREDFYSDLPPPCGGTPKAASIF